MNKMNSVKQPFGLINLGNTCYMNSVLQTLFACVDFNNSLLQEKLKAKTLSYSYQRITRIMIQRCNEKSKVKKFQLTNFINIFRKEFQHVSFHQQDAHEAMGYLLSKFHECLKGEFNNNDLKDTMKVIRYNKKIKNECARQLIKMYKNDFSLINQYFYGQMCNIIKCEDCNHEVNRVEVFKGFELGIEKSDKLLDALKEHMSIENLEGYKCDNCKKTKCNKQMILLNTPKYIFITLKRFTFNYKLNKFIKNSKLVEYPMYLHFKDYLLQENENKNVEKVSLYKLNSIINHMGGSNNGHYNTMNNINNKWYSCDDDDITKIKEDNIYSKNAYVLLYEKVDIED